MPSKNQVTIARHKTMPFKLNYTIHRRNINWRSDYVRDTLATNVVYEFSPAIQRRAIGKRANAVATPFLPLIPVVFAITSNTHFFARFYCEWKTWLRRYHKANSSTEPKKNTITIMWYYINNNFDKFIFSYFTKHLHKIDAQNDWQSFWYSLFPT